MRMEDKSVFVVPAEDQSHPDAPPHVLGARTDAGRRVNVVVPEHGGDGRKRRKRRVELLEKARHEQGAGAVLRGRPFDTANARSRGSVEGSGLGLGIGQLHGSWFQLG